MENQSQQDQTELREFDLMATEQFAHLTVREVMAKLENGDIPSVPFGK